eukprot:scaffold3883_cov210-Pinguiococcus_pyrenoidosus.AAC.2
MDRPPFWPFHRLSSGYALRPTWTALSVECLDGAQQLRRGRQTQPAAARFRPRASGAAHRCAVLRRGSRMPRLFAACCRFNTVRGSALSSQLSALSSQLSALSSQLSDQIERSLSHPTKTCSLTVTKAPSSSVMHQLIGMSVYVPNRGRKLHIATGQSKAI